MRLYVCAYLCVSVFIIYIYYICTCVCVCVFVFVCVCVCVCVYTCMHAYIRTYMCIYYTFQGAPTGGASCGIVRLAYASSTHVRIEQAKKKMASLALLDAY
jgi:hypothetical protein